MSNAQSAALRLEGVSVDYQVKGRAQRVLQGIDFTIGRGESYGLVGESGCGKSTAAYAILRYLPRNGIMRDGQILIDGQNLYGLDSTGLRTLRRKSVAMVYQDPGRALNPSLRIGRQLQEVFELAGVARSEWPARVAAILEKVRISDPQRVMQRYPHQLSGGMQQRVAIAMALASDPALLILDEPTTGLDATVEADVLDLIVQLRKEFSTSILFISHNLAVIARMCDRVGVLYAGRLVEEGSTAAIFRTPGIPTQQDFCDACRSVVAARTLRHWRPFRVSCHHPEKSPPAVSLHRAAGSPRISAASKIRRARHCPIARSGAITMTRQRILPTWMCPASCWSRRQWRRQLCCSSNMSARRSGREARPSRR